MRLIHTGVDPINEPGKQVALVHIDLNRKMLLPVVPGPMMAVWREHQAAHLGGRMADQVG